MTKHNLVIWCFIGLSILLTVILTTTLFILYYKSDKGAKACDAQDISQRTCTVNHDGSGDFRLLSDSGM
jgi:heme/copper-type cytochrome/quinol oxidase subunit 2